MVSLDAARDFLIRDARLLERRLFATIFDGAPPGPVADAVRSHRNDDGGFAHAPEPDNRAPTSQPLDVEQALDSLSAAGAWDDDIARGACEFLASIASPEGAVPLLQPDALEYPRAEHITEWTLTP